MGQKVSILIPAFNSESTIRDTILSAQKQSWRDLEIIVVDDGSTDDTFEMARKHESSNTKVLKQKNQGAAAARNHAYRLSTGDYIQWLDADDLLSRDKIEIQMKGYLSSDNPKLLQSCPWGYFMYRPWKAKFTKTELWKSQSVKDWLVLKMEKNLHMQTSTWLVSRELSDSAGPWNEKLSMDDDGEYFCRILLASDGVCFDERPKVYYRYVGSSRLSVIGGSRIKLESLLLSMKLHIKYLLELEDSPRTRNVSFCYLQTWYHHFYPDHRDLLDELQALAKELGGCLSTPVLNWKYAWLSHYFGWNAAQKAKQTLPFVKQSIKRKADSVLCKLQSKTNSNV